MPKHFPLIIANWKMNTSLADAMVMASGVKKALEDMNHVEVALAPPFVWLYPMHELLSRHPLNHLSLAAQTVNEREEGAFTGEISVAMLKLMCRYVLIGHSERVQYGENEHSINQKIRLALKWNLTPVVFVSQMERRISVRETVFKFERLTHGVQKGELEKLIAVFEPVFAISTCKDSQPTAPGDIEEAVSALKAATGGESAVLYGGSVSPKNAAGFLRIKALDGLVVGGASLKLKDFLAICQQAAGQSGTADTIQS